MRFVPWLVFLAWLFVAFNVVDFVGHCWGKSIVDRLSVSGLLLELAGLFLVYVGIVGRLKAWGETTLFGRIHRFLLKLFGQDVVVPVRTGELKGQTGAVTFSTHGTTTSPGDRTIQQQIDDLRKMVLQLQMDVGDRFVRLEERLQRETADLQEALQGLRRSLSEQIENLEVRAKSSDIRDTDMEYVGLLWIGIGLIVATLPQWVEEHIRAPLQFEWVMSAYTFLCA